MRVAVAEPRRRVREQQFSYVMTSPGPDGHRHCATIRSDGSGYTTAAGPDQHRHTIRDLEVSGRQHELSAQRCSGEHERGRHVGDAP